MNATMIRLRIQEFRELKHWSQRELAEASGVRQATISKAESGGGINLATLEALADALGVNASLLIHHEPNAKARR
jgi:transcriptional regulator with XRE-family HTH domain